MQQQVLVAFTVGKQLRFVSENAQIYRLKRLKMAIELSPIEKDTKNYEKAVEEMRKIWRQYENHNA